MADGSSVTPVSGDQAFTRKNDRGTFSEATFAGALSFMRRRYSRDLADVDVAVLGIPFDLAVSNRPGTRFGPRAVRAASSHIAWSKPWPWQADPFEALAIVDYGDCEFDAGCPAGVPDEIAETARTILAADSAILAIGGDHFVTYPLLKAHAEKYGPLSLIQFDAHSDTWADTPGRIDHGTMLYHATRDGIVDPSRSVQVGIRTHNPDTLGYNVIDACDVHRSGPDRIAERVREIVGSAPCYVTFDIDALEPAAAPRRRSPFRLIRLSMIGTTRAWCRSA